MPRTILFTAIAFFAWNPCALASRAPHGADAPFSSPLSVKLRASVIASDHDVAWPDQARSDRGLCLGVDLAHGLIDAIAIEAVAKPEPWQSNEGPTPGQQLQATVGIRHVLATDITAWRIFVEPWLHVGAGAAQVVPEGKALLSGHGRNEFLAQIEAGLTVWPWRRTGLSFAWVRSAQSPAPFHIDEYRPDDDLRFTLSFYLNDGGRSR